MQRILAGFVMYARSLDGDTTCEAFIADQGLTADYIPVGLLMPTLKSRINALETTEDAVRLAIDFVKAMKEASEPGEGEGGEDESDSEDGKKEDKADKRDNPSLGTKSDGNNDDQADPDGGDNEGDDDADGDDDDWEEDESDDWDDDADEDGEGGEDQGDTEKENKGKGDPEDGDDDAGDEGDEDGGKGEDPEGEDESPEEGEDESDDEDGGGRRKGKTLKEAMKLLLPQQRNLLFDYNNRKKSVDRIAEKRGMSRASVESGLLDARRELKRIMKGE
jgi:DNA-directed RNA polymerase specialized sigma24 family protein